MTITKKDINQTLAAIGISLILFVLLPSCGTTNKVKTSTHTKTDSTTSIKKDTASTTTKDSTHVIKDNTITTKVTDGEFTRETTIEFDTSVTGKFIREHNVIIDPTTGLVISIDGKAPEPILLNFDHRVTDFFPNQPIKKITIKETGKQSIKEQINTAKTDSIKTTSTASTEAHTEQQTHVTTETTTKNKSVKRTSYGWLWWLLIIPVGYVVYKNWGKIKKIIA